MNPLYIYNSLSRQKEKFEPLHPPFVGMYVCGPTLYSEAHLGNLRTYVSFDIVHRYLKFLGYKVRYVRNITDVGHLENDGDTGDDKIEKQAKLQHKEPMEVVEQYKQGYHKILELFNTLPPSIEPLATGHIPEQIEMVEKIMENGYAYDVNGNVYFNVRKYNEDHPYGQLSGRKIDELYNETRDLDGQQEKRDALDFALWKNVPKEHIMKWKSPWGNSGCPGWHIECSAMSQKYLGDEFDIHGGGMDLKFPHHEAEIAQSIGAIKKSPAKYWMHGNMLTFEGVKMSKSKNNSILPMELINGSHHLLDKAYSAMVVRFFMLQSHYSSELDFSNEALKGSEKGFNRLVESFDRLTGIKPKDSSAEVLQAIEKIELNCAMHMNDDFNTPKTIAELFELATLINKLYDGSLTTDQAGIDKIQRIIQNYFIEILGMKIEKAANSGLVDGLMKFILELRKEARDKKDYATSDKIRDTMKDLNITIKDGKDGAEVVYN